MSDSSLFWIKNTNLYLPVLIGFKVNLKIPGDEGFSREHEQPGFLDQLEYCSGQLR